MAETEAPSVFGSPSFEVTTDNRGRAMGKFTLPAPEGVNVRPLLYAIGRVLRAAFARNIDNGGDPAFAPLSARTLKRKALRGYPLQPLIASRLLRNSLARRGSQGNVTYISAGGVLTVGTNLRYGAVHQDGGGNNIPARPYLTLSDGDWAQISDLTQKFEQGLTVAAEGT